MERLKQISNTPDGYVISVWLETEPGLRQWLPILNFGDRQGDAMFFCEAFLDQIEEKRIREMARNYNPKVIYTSDLPADLGLEYDIFS